MPTTAEMAAQAAGEMGLLLLVAAIYAALAAHAFVAPTNRQKRGPR